MLQPMLLDVLAARAPVAGVGGWIVREVTLPCAEGDIAAQVEKLATRIDVGRLGIYPSNERFGQEVTLRLRCPVAAADTLARFDRLVQALRRQIGAAG